MQNKIRIPIVFAADDGYAMPVGVAITSLVASKKPDTLYKIYIVSPSLERRNIDFIKSLASDSVEIEFVFDSGIIEDKKATLPKVTSTDYYRLMLDAILPNEGKIIALDADLLVLEDLSELFNIDLCGNSIGGCYFRPHDVYNRKYVQERLGLDEGRRINIGVMLMDLEKIRREGLREKFISKIGCFDVMSEDIINYVCKSQIKHIPIKYNYNLHFYKFKDLLSGDPVYSPDDYESAKKSPAIFHYTLKKPWNSITERDDLWLKYYKKSPYSKIPNALARPTKWKLIKCKLLYKFSLGETRKRYKAVYRSLRDG